VSLTWAAHHLVRAEIVSLLGEPLTVRRGDVLKTIRTVKGRTYVFEGDQLQSAGR
jgi:hypothetical protein